MANITEQQLLTRIVVNPKMMVGKPVIKGTRLTVEYILGLFAHGATAAEILEEYEGLAYEDLQACFLFVSKSLESTLFMPLAEAYFPIKLRNSRRVDWLR